MSWQKQHEKIIRMTVMLKSLLIAVMFLMSTIAYGATGVVELNTKGDVAAAFARHRPMVIMFHATWCPACEATMPEFLKAAQVLGDKVDFYVMDVDKIMLRMKKQPEGIPAFVAGTSERSIRSSKSLSEGGMKCDDIVEYVKKNTKH